MGVVERERTAEQERVSLAQLRERMYARGISVRQFAEEMGMDPRNMSALLQGRLYYSARRQAKMNEVAARLGVDEPGQQRSGDS